MVRVAVGADCGAMSLGRAAAAGNLDAVKCYLDETVRDEKNDEMDQALIEASANCRPKIVEAFLESKSDVNAKDKSTTTPLMRATKVGCYDVVELLLNAGAEVNSQDAEGHTALMMALGNSPQKVKIFDILLEKGANVNLKSKKGDTALILATEDNYVDFARTLVNNGADMNLKNKRGVTALSKASSENRYQIVQYLVDSGADLGDAAILATKGSDTRKFLTEHAKKTPLTPLMSKIANGLENDAVEYLMENLQSEGFNIDARDWNGLTALIWASRKGQSIASQLLIDNKADINAQDVNGKTALIWAAAMGRDPVIQLLKNAGADTEILDNFGNKASDFSSVAKKSTKVSTVKPTPAPVEPTPAPVEPTIKPSPKPTPKSPPIVPSKPTTLVQIFQFYDPLIESVDFVSNGIQLSSAGRPPKVIERQTLLIAGFMFLILVVTICVLFCRPGKIETNSGTGCAVPVVLRSPSPGPAPIGKLTNLKSRSPSPARAPFGFIDSQLPPRTISHAIREARAAEQERIDAKVKELKTKRKGRR